MDNYYNILNIREDAPATDINNQHAAFLQLQAHKYAKRTRKSDKVILRSEPMANVVWLKQRFIDKQMTEAFKTLTDPSKRAEYDAALEAERQRAAEEKGRDVVEGKGKRLKRKRKTSKGKGKISKEKDDRKVYKIHAPKPKSAHTASAAHPTSAAHTTSTERSKSESDIRGEKNRIMIASSPTLGGDEREESVGDAMSMPPVDSDTLIGTEPESPEMVTLDEVDKLMDMEGF